jgi:hypothetical protein
MRHALSLRFARKVRTEVAIMYFSDWHELEEVQSKSAVLSVLRRVGERFFSPVWKLG